MTQKAIFQLPIGAGLYTEETERGAIGQWYKADKVRFRKGLAEKIGGWVRLQPQFLGTCRRLKDWTSLDAKKWSAVATDVKLYLWQQGSPPTLYDITPLRDQGTLTSPFTTSIGLFTVDVGHVNHGESVGSYVRFSGATAIGGITIDGEYQVTSVTDENNYVITHTSAATGSAGPGGGLVAYEYDILAGVESAITATGYGTGPYGREGYGNARTGSTLVIGIRTWSLDTWGEDLLACARGGPIYWWDRSKGTGTRAEALDMGGAPPNNEYMIVSQRDRHILALGAYDFFNSAFDPLLIRWSSTEDLNDWIPTSTNTSGDLRLYSGSKIVAGVRSRLETVIFTDVSVHTIPFVGGFDVFGLNIVGENVSILGPNCAVPVDHRVIFMAESDFYLYDGVVRVMNCDVRNFVYDNLNEDQKDKVYGGLNREFNEVWWFYPSFDPLAYSQQDFSLGLPPGYSIENGTDVVGGDPLFSEVEFLADFEGADGATSYTELSNNGTAVTFVGNAEIDTAQANSLTSSIVLDGTGDFVTVPDLSPLFADNDWTVEGFVRFNTTPPLETSLGPGYVLYSMWGASGPQEILSYAIIQDGFGFRVRLEGEGFAEVGTISGGVTTGVWYHWAVTRSSTDGNIRGYFNGLYETADFGAAPASMGTASAVTRFGSLDGVAADHDGWLDDVRITIGTARYSGTGAYAVPTAPFATGGSGAADVGYNYDFNSGGYTEVATVSAQNGYDYTYFLTNGEAIIEPLNAGYAVEFDWNPARAVATNTVGLVFLHQDITGTGETEGDSFKGFIFRMDFDADQLQIRKRDPTGALSVPDNAGTGNAVFSAITTVAPAVSTKYILTAEIITTAGVPQITCYVSGIQVFQFDMSAQEILDHTGGTVGHYVGESATAFEQARFYNLSSGPDGVLTSPTFDISPIEVNRYVAFNYEEDTWTTGQMARTAWADRSPLLEKAYATGTDGYIYQHETGTDSVDETTGDTIAMDAFIESFDMEIPQAGEELMHVDQLIPDFLELEGSVTVNLTGKKYPGVIDRIEKGPFTVVPGTRKLSTRMRARQIAIKMSSSGTGDKWRAGHWRGRAGPHGRRG